MSDQQEVSSFWEHLWILLENLHLISTLYYEEANKKKKCKFRGTKVFAQEMQQIRN